MATYNNIAYGNIGPLGGASGHVLLQTLTASSDATLSFTSGIDDTYQSYLFKFINIHPSSRYRLTFKVSLDMAELLMMLLKTSTHFQTYHNEA